MSTSGIETGKRGLFARAMDILASDRNVSSSLPARHAAGKKESLSAMLKRIAPASSAPASALELSSGLEEGMMLDAAL